MAQFICEKQGRCCPHEFYDSVEQAIDDSEDGVPCDHLIDVAPVRHGRCPVCSGNAVLTQDCDNGYSLEIDAEQAEASLWYGDACLAVFHIDFCPNCGAKMDGDNDG